MIHYKWARKQNGSYRIASSDDRWTAEIWPCTRRGGVRVYVWSSWCGVTMSDGWAYALNTAKEDAEKSLMVRVTV